MSFSSSDRNIYIFIFMLEREFKLLEIYYAFIYIFIGEKKIPSILLIISWYIKDTSIIDLRAQVTGNINLL